jgi:hypothetical protein
MQHPQADALVSATRTAELDDVELADAQIEVSQSQAQSDAMARQFAAAVGQDEERPTRPSLPFGARAAPTAASGASSSSSSSSSTTAASESASSTTAASSSSLAVRAAHVGRTPPPPLPEYQVLGSNKAVGFGRVVWAGLKVFSALEFVGEVFADFFGLYDSKYQYVVDAYERNKRELEFERAERAALRREHREEQERTAEQNDPTNVRTEQNRAEQAERAKNKASNEESKEADSFPAEEQAV